VVDLELISRGDAVIVPACPSVLGDVGDICSVAADADISE